MGEIPKRTKHKWMRGTAKGPGTILNLILTWYVSEESYEVFKHMMMRRDNLKFIRGMLKLYLLGVNFN